MGVNKSNILKAVFKSKDGVSWNELSEYLNEYAKDLLMELYENDMIEPHKNFMCGEEINTVEDGILKLINWHESRGETSNEAKATLPINSVSGSLCVKALTKKMIEARQYVDKHVQLFGTKPTYRLVAKKLGIKYTAAYHRLRGYRHMMVRRQ